MTSIWWLAGLVFLPLQVPRPFAGEELARELEAARRSVVERESADLKGLADHLAAEGKADAAAAVRSRLPRPVAPDGPTRFVPLPIVVPARPSGRAAPRDARLDSILARSATDFLDLARRAAKAVPPRYALAGECIRAVVDRRPDDAEARRLLGYMSYKGGWARPFAVEQFRLGYIDHPVFGWVKADWQPHLDQGELPTPPPRKLRWLLAAEADQLRANWSQRWRISTEHFQIETNVPLAKAIGFGRRLEAFHDLFMAVMADVQGENSPLARRFHDSELVGEPKTKPHLVYYFASKGEYLDHLGTRYPPDKLERSLGFYDPPKLRTGRMPAYFYRDPDADVPDTANLYHEVSHQLLFETSGPNRYTQNAGNYWVFEGLGTYFETVEPQPDGSLEVGGRVGRRMEAAIQALVDLGRTIPLERFVAYDEASFTRDDPAVYLRYQQAMALTVFLMQWHDGAYREGFLDYVRDAYHGLIRRGTGRKLEDRVGETYGTLESQLLTFLRSKPHVESAPRPVAKPAAQPKNTGAIRTVPSQ